MIKQGLKSVILIGMPGTGKSTVGVLLAKELGLDFVDTDILIQLREHKSLQDIIDDAGYIELRKIEEQVLLENDYSSKAVATGGSAIYSEKAMVKLAQVGQVIYLSCSLDELQSRIGNYRSRGIAASVGQQIGDLAKERTVLYEQYADFTVDTSSKAPAQVVEEILNYLQINHA
ncbi:MAG: shikimate kinase [Proteobacteria bacterium]|jgi:shikimate kinase|nr:shikimate kinase [Pseudomonadota bacterium]